MAKSNSTENWAEQIGRKVYLSLAAGRVYRVHTTGVIKRLTKTMIIVDGANGETYRFSRNRVAADPIRDSTGKGGYGKHYMNKNDYMGMDK
jgi:hypothetical protein